MARGELTPLDKKYKAIISNNIVEIAQRKNMRQADIVHQSGLAKSTINGYFKGTSIPTRDNLLKLAHALNVSPADIDPRYKSNTEPKTPADNYDLDAMLDNAHSYDGKPLDDHDRELIRQYLKALLNK
ncbi:XRE family transcriptional regulator [Lactobacillus johnsonii]|uniref:helix-turn-helix domain-containing protein n=1 Tax=Lactobacillus johnsonii TaxID=33959 RepID=UPI0021A3DCF3|nr:helix-turn-helix transcriptional regulator [Lactobacillus johnsonii]MCT3342586.1 XRE family transcriptional regulator [Lactobacillus johnsonii]